MDKRVHELLNQQINKEFYSAYLYLDFSNYFDYDIPYYKTDRFLAAFPAPI